MAKNRFTVFQTLERALKGNFTSEQGIKPNINSYDMSGVNAVLYKTTDKADYERTKLELQQNKYLKNQWIKANVDMSVTAYSNLSHIQLMYREAELMDAFPEIGAALDTYAEESVLPDDHGLPVTVYSKSDRIRAILEDLFVNRLNLQITAPMVIRGMCKYGNQFMLLDIDNKLGVKGWKQLPVFHVERLENGIQNAYGSAQSLVINNNPSAADDLSTKFVWTDENNSQIPFRNWQIAHFRMLTNSLCLPYGTSILNAARRHWRMLALMEDMMLIYRLERSIERRVYKVYVGAIDDADVQAYVEQVANSFKRTPIIDPMTGQIDLRKNILPVHKDTPIPLLDGRTITIKELADEFEQGKENYVYSIQDNTLKIVPGKVVWCGKNYTAKKLIKVTLDDNSFMVMAPEHEVVMRDGSKKRADELLEGESLMPFYTKVDKKSKKLFDRYEKVYNPNSGKYEFTHRLIAEHVTSSDESFNTVHHKDFNKYNNSPTNLLWMDYHEHHKMHGELARKNWNDPEKRALHIKHLSESCKGRIVADKVKEKISKKLKMRYSNGDFDELKRKSSERITEYNSSEEAIEKRREQGKKLGYIEAFRKYNESELHKEHDEIRRKTSKESWEGEGRSNRIEKMSVRFDDFIWDEIHINLLNGIITSQNKMIEFINEHLIDHLLEINVSKKLHHYKKVTKPLVKARIIEKGFANFADYYSSIKKNHKVKFIEETEGDDVYCMTVVGLNGEDDRHNFALKTWELDSYGNKVVHESGVFVSNCVDQDIFIPTRNESAPTPIDTLPAAQNLTAMDDIKFVQNKVLTALRIPKTFLNFEENAGDGKNLALMDVRFTRVINRIQQSFLMELTKVASIHLYLLGFEDDLTNFSLSMKNPSTQAEQLEIDNIQKKISAVRDAVSDPGNGLPVMSMTRALKQIMKWSDKEIKENLEEIRLEKGLAAELEKTAQIIKRTGIFDIVDRVYGEPGAEYQDDAGMGGPDQGMGGGMPGGGGGGSFGSGLDDLGAPGAEEEGDINGAEGSEPTANMQSNNDVGNMPPTPQNESVRSKNVLLEHSMERIVSKEKKRINDSVFDQYLSLMEQRLNEQRKSNTVVERTDVYDKSLLLNEDFTKMIDSLNDIINEKAD